MFKFWTLGWAIGLLSLFLFLTTPSIAAPTSSQQATKMSRVELCKSLTDYYIKTWQQHQHLAYDIRMGRYWPEGVLENQRQLLNMLGEFLNATARQMERHKCELDDEEFEDLGLSDTDEN